MQMKAKSQIKQAWKLQLSALDCDIPPTHLFFCVAETDIQTDYIDYIDSAFDGD